MTTETAASTQVGRGIGRYGLAIVVSLPALLIAVTVWELTSVYSSHFCGWPASISCETGLWLFWLVPIGVSLVAVAGTALLLRWAYYAEGRSLLGLLHALWTYGWLVIYISNEDWLPFAERGLRTFGPEDIVGYGIYGLLGIELLRRAALVFTPKRRRIGTAVALLVAAGFIVILVALPSLLEVEVQPVRL